MTKNLMSALKCAGIKPTREEDLSSNKEFMEGLRKYSEVLKKFILDKENFEKSSSRDIVFKIRGNYWYSAN